MKILQILLLLSGLSLTGWLLTPCGEALARTPDSPYGESNAFNMNTNRIGFGDSETLVYAGAPDEDRVPRSVMLDNVTPNPFNPKTKIFFTVGRRASVELHIYDLCGRRVRSLVSQEFEAGRYSHGWDGRSDDGSALPTGVYLARIKGGGTSESKKITLLK